MADYEKNNTITGICNSALAMVGHTDFIKDIDDTNSTVAEACRLLFHQCCQEVQMFEYGAWDELYRDIALTLRGEVLNSNRRMEWNLPFDKLTIIDCYKKDTMEPVEFELHGNYLWCNEDKDVCIKYIRFSINPSEWSPELRAATIELLSIKLIGTIVKDYKGAESMRQQFWDVSYPRWVACRKNKNSRHDYKGDDNIITRNYRVHGQGFVDRY